VSFIATAALTFVAIAIGYLSNSLPDATLTQLDRAFVAKLSRSDGDRGPETVLSASMLCFMTPKSPKQTANGGVTENAAAKVGATVGLDILNA